MKKLVRTVYIGALSGLAFLAACCTTKGLSKAEKKQLEHDRDSIQQILARREGAAVYGSPEIIQEYGKETQRMRDEIQAIRKELKELNTPQDQINQGKTETLYGSPQP